MRGYLGAALQEVAKPWQGTLAGPFRDTQYSTSPGQCRAVTWGDVNAGAVLTPWLRGRYWFPVTRFVPHLSKGSLCAGFCRSRFLRWS